MNEKEFFVKETVLNELYSLCGEIEKPEAPYSKDQLVMANRVISTAVLNAATIRTILDGIVNG